MSSIIKHHPKFHSTYVADRDIEVWLPPDYGENPEQRYRVLYMHDGQNLFEAEKSYAGYAWEVAPALENLIRENKVPPTIIVGIANTELRFEEYLPRKPFAIPGGDERMANLEPPLREGPYSDEYLKFVVEELKPFIDANYLTLTRREDTAIMGGSMGGLMSIYAACEYPEVFGMIGCISTHWPALEGVLVLYLEEKLPEAGNHRIYFDHGTEDFDALYPPFQAKVDALMSSKSYTEGEDWVTRCFEGHEHSERAFSERIHIPLEFLLSR